MTAAGLVDSHCHLPLLEESADGLTAAEALRAAAEAGVTHVLCVSVDLDSFPALRDLAARYPNVYASAGLHPNSTVSREPSAEELVELARDPAVVAVGETGLDYYRSTGDLEWQRQRFRAHIAAARAVGKPLIIHSRDAREDIIRILREENAHEVGGVMHCFVDDLETAKAAMDLGFYISFSGIVTFKSAVQVQEVARAVPLDRLLVETDSPYLAPVPYRGKTNQPAYVREVALFLAKLRNTDYESLAAATTANFFELFRHATRH